MKSVEERSRACTTSCCIFTLSGIWDQPNRRPDQLHQLPCSANPSEGVGGDTAASRPKGTHRSLRELDQVRLRELVLGDAGHERALLH